jgi:hypothetical protein
VSCKAGGGTFTLTYGGQTTSPIPYNAKAADLLAFIGALPNIGVGNVKIVMFGTQGTSNIIITILILSIVFSIICLSL